jgi:hypothetical protein
MLVSDCRNCLNDLNDLNHVERGEAYVNPDSTLCHSE